LRDKVDPRLSKMGISSIVYRPSSIVYRPESSVWVLAHAHLNYFQ